MNHAAAPAKVYLVGAGPGDPGLLTVRAIECLQQADLVLYDQLLSRRILDQIPPHVEQLCVSELPGSHPERWPHIHQRMIAEARQGKCVVRLKSGDPLIFGRGGEEAEALHEAGIPYELVPGVTTALAAGSYLEISLTHRQHSSALALVTGHEVPGKPDSRVDYSSLAQFPGTLAFYMGISRLPAIIAELIKHGKSPDTPALIVHDVSTGEQRAVTARLIDLENARRQAGIETPALILIGTIVGKKNRPSWFERRPLYGKRILVTRPRHQAETMMRSLELLGAVPYLLPAVEITPPDNWHPVDATFDRLRQGEFDWLVFTSSNGVKAYLNRLLQVGHDLRLLGRVQLAAIGPATAETLASYHLKPDVVPSQEFRAEELAEVLRDRVRGKRVLLARANRAREVLREQLSSVASIEQVIVYHQTDAVDSSSEVFDCLRRGEIDVITFTSSNIARAVLRHCDETIRKKIARREIQIATISPVTSEAVRELGFEVACEARIYTIDGLISALVENLGNQHATNARD